MRPRPAPKNHVPLYRRPTEKAHPKPRGISPRLFYAIFAGLFATNVLTALALLMMPDISALLEGRNRQVIGAYEDRIAQLRVEVDRLHSRQFAQSGDINIQLQELTQQQEVLLEQQQLVTQLAQKAQSMGIAVGPTASAPNSDGPKTEPAPAAVSAYAPAPANKSTTLGQVSATMDRIADENRLALAALGETADVSTDKIVDTLGRLGIATKLPDQPKEGVGGPYLPPEDGADNSSIVDDANAVFAALARFSAAQTALSDAPVHIPLNGLYRISSGYGNRTDPFTGGRAFHSGIDFSAPRGKTVLSAGAGKISFVGERSGYGNTVEVTHAGGIITRYGHLSAFLVAVGQTVDTGTPIARVGSTGRSTGPHLHFEVRRDDRAVDPNIYLGAGRSLSQFLSDIG
jgi:murein DD-endopeptidase MepM/ murein hydrolase activator NlpD